MKLVTPNRRAFLKATLGGAAVATLAQWAPQAAFARSKATPLAATKLNDRVTVLSGAGANVVAIGGADGALLVDGGLEARSGELLKLALKETSAKRVSTLINTHWHPEQTGSNVALGGRGTRIIAHENTRLWLGTDIDSTWQRRHFAPLPRAGLPSETFYTTGHMNHGGEQIDYGYLLQAHTDGDIYVYLRGSNVLVVGDLLAAGAYPVSDPDTNGWINGMVAANKALLDLAGEATRIVPGQGPVQTRADLQRQYEMLVVVRDRLFDQVKQGLDADEMLAARPTRDYDERWGNPELFIRNAAKGMAAHARQITGVV